MTAAALHYFARGNTARGDYFLYDSALQSLSRLFLLQGLPGTGKSTMLKRIAENMLEQGWNVELFHSPLNAEELDAVIIAELNTGIADAERCGLSTQGGSIVSIDFNQAMNQDLVSGTGRETIESLQPELAEAFSQAYATFAEALSIHDEWESFYTESMDFRKANETALELADSLFGSRTLEKKARVRHLFFGAATSSGAVDHIQNLTSGLDRRIFIKGRAGSGKSTLLKRLAATAEAQGFDVDVFHCGFDPNSLDMVLVPELRLAVFDSTAPHEYFPDRVGDSVVDMYKRVIKPGIDERYAVELSGIISRYSRKMKEATACLESARQIDARIKAVYSAATDFAAVDRIHRELQASIDELAANR